MTIDERVRSANPITKAEQLDRLFGHDASERLFRDIEPGRVVRMPDTNDRLDNEPNRAARRGWLVAAGIALIGVTIAAVGALANSGGTEVAAGATSVAPATTSAPATPARPTTTTALSPVDVVVSSLDAYNSGDTETWLAHFSEDAVVFRESRAAAADFFGPFLAANSRMEKVGACALGEPAASGEAVVTCTIAESNDFHGAGGITVVMSATFLIDDNMLISRAGPPDFGYVERRRFNTTFWSWLEATYPDAYDQIQLQEAQEGSDGSSFRGPDTPEHMRIALVYVEEFVAQSTEFPVQADS